MKVQTNMYISISELMLSMLLLICGVSVGYFVANAPHHSISFLEVAMLVFGCILCCGALSIRQVSLNKSDALEDGEK